MNDTAAAGGLDDGAQQQQHQTAQQREPERFLPVANIARIMKKGLPANAKIAKVREEGGRE
jgi:histone H3/H4